MAMAMAKFSTSHAVRGLGFNEHEQGMTTRYNVRKVAATSRFLVQNSSTQPSEDSVVTRVRVSGGKTPSPITSKRAELGLKLEDEGRSKLLGKLSEANQYIRHLQRELRDKDMVLMDTASELSTMEMELQALVDVAQEISRQGIKPGTRKINGRYIHSHLASRLEEIQKILHERIKDADQVRTRDIELAFYGMAEDVQVMGSFDGWTRGQSMSPESKGTFTRFSTTIKLRPGRYEIKFMVDGAWRMSPYLPTVGQGVTMNNLLIVDQFQD